MKLHLCLFILRVSDMDRPGIKPGDAEDFPLDANGPAYTASQQLHGVPLDYVGSKLASAIEDLHRFAINHPEYRRELIAPMYDSIVAYLALHNMLAKANDRSLVPRLLDASTDELHNWLAFVRRVGDVAGVAGLGPD